MSSKDGWVEVAGSDHTPLPNAKEVGTPDLTEQIEVSVILRSNAQQETPTARGAATKTPGKRARLSRSEFARRLGSTQADIDRVVAFAGERGLEVVETDIAKRRVVLAGPLSDMSAAFQVQVRQYRHPNGAYRARTGPVKVPPELGPIITGVFGLGNRTAAKPHYRRLANAGLAPRDAAAGPPGLSPRDVAKLYGFPIDEHDGSGECVALLELDSPRDPQDPTHNVGAGFSDPDLTTYFQELGIDKPKVIAVSVDHGQNLPAINPGADGEVMLDVEVVGAVAPGARIAVYFAPNTTRGFIDAILAAVHDVENNPSAISISWGMAEDVWSPQARLAMDEAFRDAGALGITVFCAAGDDGSSDGMEDSDNLAHVDFPASSPNVVACGGTQIEVTKHMITSEVVWNNLAGNEGAGGGGISAEFGMPAYQANAGIPTSANAGAGGGRGVPDIAANASPITGYRVRVDGREEPIGGTSAVAPLWAGLTALVNEALGERVGFLNPLLYDELQKANALQDITVGDNGDYAAGVGWDACTGLGSPKGAEIVKGLSIALQAPSP